MLQGAWEPLTSHSSCCSFYLAYLCPQSSLTQKWVTRRQKTLPVSSDHFFSSSQTNTWIDKWNNNLKSGPRPESIQKLLGFKWSSFLGVPKKKGCLAICPAPKSCFLPLWSFLLHLYMLLNSSLSCCYIQSCSILFALNSRLNYEEGRQRFHMGWISRN